MSNENTKQTGSGLGDNLDRIKHEVGDTVRDVTHSVSQHGGKVQQQVKEGVDHATQELQAGVNEAKTTFSKLGRDTHQYVKDRPYVFIAIGAGVGFLYGLSRRR